MRHLTQRRHFIRGTAAPFYVAAVLCLTSNSLSAQVVYTNDFQSGAAGPAWSIQRVSTTPLGGRRFLGPFGAGSASLSLGFLPQHSAVSVTFDLYVIQSWDGNDEVFGPDVWSLTVPGERILIRTTFSNGGIPQSYPGTFPFESGTGLRGSKERGTLGYTSISGFAGVTDSVYRITRTFAHFETTLVLKFASGLAEPISNESWGLDNIVVSVSNPGGGVVEFSAPIFYGRESATNAVLALRRTGSVNSPASVDFTTSNGTANAAGDYIATTGTVTFSTGETEKQIVIPIIDDAVGEARDEIFTLTLNNPSASTELGHPASALVAIIDNDTTDVHFTQELGSPLAYEGGDSQGAAWGDYDNDGYLDLFVSNFEQQRNFLYRNNGDGTFHKVLTGPVATDLGNSVGAAWADYDNDGDLDLFVAGFGSSRLYRNDGRGSFVKVQTGAIANLTANANGCAWGDYDNDGNVDLFVVTDNGANLLFRNTGNGTFTRITSGRIVTDTGSSIACAWGDYDEDGFLDLFVANRGGQANFLYHNNRNGTFTRIASGSIVTDAGDFYSCSWVDVNNDGRLDLFVAAFSTRNFLYRNNGDGTFTKAASGSFASDEEYSVGSAWADVNNDGFLDAYVANFTPKGSLYLNTGLGTFTKKLTSGLARDFSPAAGVAWGDVNRDGSQDIFLAKYQNQNNCLYLNQGSGGAYLTVLLRGTLSNGSGIGARVRVMTLKDGVQRWQTREISGGNGTSQNAMEASFGLGMTEGVDLLQIAWPSGAVQNWTNVLANQMVTIVEGPQITAAVPSGLVGVVAKTGAKIVLEASSNLSQWVTVLETNAPAAPFTFRDLEATTLPARFYRSRYVR